MPLTIAINTSALSPGAKTRVAASGGTAPYTYSVVGGGAGGTISASTGLYTAPEAYGTDTIRVTDAVAATADVSVYVNTALELVCDIIRTEMGLSADQVFLWDQKFQPPKDSRLYIAVGVVSQKAFGSSNKPTPSGSNLLGAQSVNMQAMLSIDVYSRAFTAVQRKEEIILALGSTYSEQQQTANSFNIARLTTTFANISELDGPAIPYRFSLAVNIQYAVRKTKAIPFFENFEEPEVTVDA